MPQGMEGKGRPDIAVRAQTGESGNPPPPGSCVLESPLEPFTLIIFGASGDLTGRKLVPALYNLFMAGLLPEAFTLVGVGRTPMLVEEFRRHLEYGIRRYTGLDLSRWPDFGGKVFYYPADYQSADSMLLLADHVSELARIHGTGSNRLYYLATPPSAYGPISECLGGLGLTGSPAIDDRPGSGWTRLVVEKPFAHDLTSARELDRILGRYFREEQIYRIDHYVAKETVQNILLFRFANAIFEPIWNRRYIERISIVATETVGVEHRAGHYEQTGVLRDMFQNHMLHLLTMAAMEPPSALEASMVADEKTKVLRSLRPFPVQTLDDHILLAQYVSGTVDGRPVSGYRSEPGVAAASVVPTLALMKTYVDNWRWQGVPFYLFSGKRLPRKLTRMVIRFKPIPHSMFRGVLREEAAVNQLILGIQPEETIHLTFQTKNPGARLCLRTVRLEFDYARGTAGPPLNAYEKALLDCCQGDHLLFWRGDGVLAAWEYMMPVIDACEQCADPGGRLHFHPAGTWGPPEVAEMISVLTGEG